MAWQAMSPGGRMTERDKIMKINQSGVEARATVDPDDSQSLTVWGPAS